MGNCQASEAATVVIQHPGGKVERFYWPISAADVMKSNPGYYVALVTLYVSEQKRDGAAAGAGGGTVRFTRVRLLKAKDILLLGQVYRLIATQDVTKALRQRKHDKLKKSHAELMRKQQQEQVQQRARQHKVVQEKQQEEHSSENAHQVTGDDRDWQKSSSGSCSSHRQWRPSLHSISEMGGA